MEEKKTKKIVAQWWRPLPKICHNDSPVELCKINIVEIEVDDNE